jgi:hypothetical protein
MVLHARSLARLEKAPRFGMTPSWQFQTSRPKFETQWGYAAEAAAR